MAGEIIPESRATSVGISTYDRFGSIPALDRRHANGRYRRAP
jgi:hypothetical protein